MHDVFRVMYTHIAQRRSMAYRAIYDFSNKNRLLLLKHVHDVYYNMILIAKEHNTRTRHILCRHLRVIHCTAILLNARRCWDNNNSNAIY